MTTCLSPTLAREYRYDGDRPRYLVRDRDPETLEPLAGGGRWREHLGDDVYADLAVDEATGAAATLRRYVFAGHGAGLSGYGSAGLAAWREGGEWCVAHADMLGSTRVVSNGAGAAANGLAYAAFGELATSSAPSNALYKTRFGFCGAWGYESDYLYDGAADPLAAAGLMHVGARYYEPATGRFTQRDPIGISGGVLVYGFALNSPTNAVDPTGLGPTLPSLSFGVGIANLTMTMGAGMAFVVWNYVQASGVVSTGNPTADAIIDGFVDGITLGAGLAPWVGGPRLACEGNKLVWKGFTGWGN